jgi:MoxR-like ATPase
MVRRVRCEAAVALWEQRPQPGIDGDSLYALLDSAKTSEVTARAGNLDLPWFQLAHSLALRPLDELLLAATIALERDPTFTIMATGLHGNPPTEGMTWTLFAQVLRLSGAEGFELELDDRHSLVAAGLIETASHTQAMTTRPYRASPRTVSFLEGWDRSDPILDRAGSMVAVPEGLDLEHATDALALLTRILTNGEDVITCIEGPDGVGRRTLAAIAAARAGLGVFAVDATRLSSDRARFGSELVALRRECRLRGALPLISHIDALTPDQLDDVARSYDGAMLVTGTIGAKLPVFRRRVVRLHLDSPSAIARQKIWTRLVGPGSELATAIEGAPIAELAQRYSLNPGAIHNSVANARMIAGGRPVSVTDIRKGISAEIKDRFGSLATRIEVAQRWEDLVLPNDTLDDVLAFVSRAKNASMVYDDWGFRAKLQRGLGLLALFSGPPGTGKTMVAGLIARELELELYMIDLSQVVSKWVGETEKQLGKIFDAAAFGQALLLFDEADALFARRTDVKSSNDRYANLEVNYLLQKLEAFAGVAILTTNLETSIDPALKRRLAADIRFTPPERAERETLWRTVVPKETPVAPNLQFGRLADDYADMCGGHIRNAVLRAAFLAAAERKPISQHHLERAARSEYRSMGKILSG